MTERILRFLVLPIAVVLLAPAGARADYWDEFKLGRDAVEAGNWAAAEKHLRAAIAESPEAKRRTFGARYTPYYYLGIVLQETSDCRGALDQWKTSEKYDIVKAGSEESVDRAKRKARCEQLVGDVTRARGDADRAVAEGRSALAGVDRLRPSLADAWTSGNPSFAARRDEAVRLLDQAAKEATEADKALDLDSLQTVRRAAEQATRNLRTLSTDAEKLLDAASAERSEARRQLDEAQGSGEELLSSVASLKPYPEGLGRRVSSVRRALGRAEQRREEADVEELRRLTQDLKRAVDRLRSSSAEPPRPLMEAADAFMNHNFQETLDRLDAAELRGDRALFHAELLRAASYHSLYVLGGMGDPELLKRARESIRTCAAFDGADGLGAPGERFFSSGFLTLWSSTVEAVRAEEAEAESTEESP